MLSVALAGSFPLNERGPANGRFRIEGKPPVAAEALPRADFQRVSPDYFKTIGVPILKGRSLEPADRKDAPLSPSSTSRWRTATGRGEDPIGRRIGVDGREPGEVHGSRSSASSGDVRQYGLANPPVEQVYCSLLQYPASRRRASCARPWTRRGWSVSCAPTSTRSDPSSRWTTSARSPKSVARRARLAAADGDPARCCSRLSPLTITATGIAGVIAFSVGQRRSEFGIRMALGALPSSVQRMVLRAGDAASCWPGWRSAWRGRSLLTRLWASLLYEVAPTDPADVLRRGAAARRGRGGSRASSRRAGRRRWIRWWRCGVSRAKRIAEVVVKRCDARQSSWRRCLGRDGGRSRGGGGAQRGGPDLSGRPDHRLHGTVGGPRPRVPSTASAAFHMYTVSANDRADHDVHGHERRTRPSRSADAPQARRPRGAGRRRGPPARERGGDRLGSRRTRRTRRSSCRSATARSSWPGRDCSTGSRRRPSRA